METFQAQKIQKEVKVRGPISKNETHSVDAGTLNASKGDYIIDDGNTSYPIKPDIFHESYIDIPNNIKEINKWVTVKKKPIVVTIRGPIDSSESINTLEGRVTAPMGYYVVTGSNKEQYALSPEEFDDNYERL